MKKTKNLPSQNGSPLPFSETDLDRLHELSDDELSALANESPWRFVGCMKDAIEQHARLAGAALNVLKKRIPYGQWTDWLKANFKGSPETARRYSRIAEEWAFVEEHGLDRLDHVTLNRSSL